MRIFAIILVYDKNTREIPLLWGTFHQVWQEKEAVFALQKNMDGVA